VSPRKIPRSVEPLRGPNHETHPIVGTSGAINQSPLAFSGARGSPARLFLGGSRQ
jgi:hypothetical protein